MAEPKSIYSCTECGGQTVKWQGQRPHCDAWHALVESTVEATGKAGAHRFRGGVRIVEPGADPRSPIAGLEVVPVERLVEAVDYLK